jgi:hypothetical protein
VSQKIASEILTAVFGKGLIAPRPKSRKLCGEILLMCVEIEKFEIVEGEAMAAIESKNPKVVAGVVELITLAIR